MDDTGLKSWSLSKLLSMLILKNAGFFDGKRLLELGCGIDPVAKILFSTQFAADVVVSDGNPAVVEKLKASDLGGFATLLDWDKVVSSELTLQKFDVLLAAEVLYFNVDVSNLLRCVASLMNKKGILIWTSHLRGFSMKEIADACRQHALTFRLFDISRTNESVGKPLTLVQGHCFLSIVHFAGMDCAGFPLENEISMEKTILEEEEDEKEEWVPPFFNHS